MADGLFEQIKKNTKQPLPKEWASILEPGTASYEMAVLLNAQNKLPSIAFNADMLENGTYSKSDNALVLNPTLSSPDKKNVLAHELTHALNYKMQEEARALFGKSRRQGEESLSQPEKQFYSAWNKLDPDFSKLSKFNYPVEGYNQYRHSFTEAPAFAVGRMEDPRKSLTRGEYWETSPAGGHVDATLAQEQAILRDLYARKQQPTTPWYKDPFGFSIK